MKIRNFTAIRRFVAKHRESRNTVMAWVSFIQAVKPKNYAELKSALGVKLDKVKGSDDLYVFDIRGNRYRVVAEVKFSEDTITIVRIGLHKEYDRWVH